jgi:hypothetical protein
VLSPHLPAAAAALIIYCVCLFCFLSLGGRLRVFTPVYIPTLAKIFPAYFPLSRASIVDPPPALKDLLPSNAHKCPAEASYSASELRVMGYGLFLQWHD